MNENEFRDLFLNQKNCAGLIADLDKYGYDINQIMFITGADRNTVKQTISRRRKGLGTNHYLCYVADRTDHCEDYYALY